jgi:ElaB/YqjD/DUF883 family membrane-anchored ribosome-binding protein
MKTRSNSTMRKARKAATDATHETLQTSRDAADSLYERARGGVQALGQGGVGMVRHHPFKTALTALAVGFALGFTMRR